jgi:transposase
MGGVETDLREEIALLREVLAALREQLRASQRDNEKLRHQLDQLLRRLYGRRTERADPNQHELDLGLAEPAERDDEDDDPGAPGVEDAPAPRRRHRGRRKLPKDLPRTRIVLAPAPADLICSCCQEEKVRIGADVTEELEYEPAVLSVNEYERPKYACRQCEAGVVQAPLPARPIDKGMAGPGLLAHVVVSKYSEHLPLHRQELIFPRAGLALSRTTLCDWVARVAELTAPVVGYMKTHGVLASRVIHSDDTRITVQDPRHPGGSRPGYLWVYGGSGGDLVYDFTPSRSRAGPLEFIADWQGYFQADAYSGYDELFRTGRVIEVGCWSHARRRFFEAVKTAIESATLALGLIRRLYAVEREAKTRALGIDDRRALRQEKSQPILDRLGETLADLGRRHLPKSPMGDAIGYAQRQWDALARYVEDGELEIDNNRSERALRIVAVGRKNWMFAGSDEGGRRAAILYSLVATCKNIGVDPFAYLRDVLSRIATHPMRRIEELTPRGWRAQQLAANPA